MLINGGAINGVAINGLYVAVSMPALYYAKPSIRSLSFNCVITGSPDIQVPISSINGELVGDGTSSIAIVCPDGNGYALLISERLSGNIIISTTENYTDGTSAIVGSNEYAITYMSSDKGANSHSLSIRGKYTLVTAAALKYDSVGVSSISTNIEGKRRVRLDYNSDLRVNDVLIVEDDELVIGSISYVINPDGSYMYCSEV